MISFNCWILEINLNLYPCSVAGPQIASISPSTALVISPLEPSLVPSAHSFLTWPKNDQRSRHSTPSYSRPELLAVWHASSCFATSKKLIRGTTSTKWSLLLPESSHYFCLSSYGGRVLSFSLSVFSSMEAVTMLYSHSSASASSR